MFCWQVSTISIAENNVTHYSVFHKCCIVTFQFACCSIMLSLKYLQVPSVTVGSICFLHFKHRQGLGTTVLVCKNISYFVLLDIQFLSINRIFCNTVKSQW